MSDLKTIPGGESFEIRYEDGSCETIPNRDQRRLGERQISEDPHPTRMMPAMTPDVEAMMQAKKEVLDKPTTKKSKQQEAEADTLEAITEDPKRSKDSRDLAGFYRDMRDGSKARGHSTEVIDKAAGEALATELKTLRARDPQKLYREYMANRPADAPYAASDRLPAAKPTDKPILEGYVSESENPWQAFKTLPPEQAWHNYLDRTSQSESHVKTILNRVTKLILEGEQ